MARVARARAQTKKPLSADRIGQVALALIETEGLEAFSIRKLAAELGCEAMSIYHYFPSKGHLMDALVDRVMGEEMEVLGPDPARWRKRIEASARQWRAMALKYPHFFGFLAMHRLNTPKALRWLDGILALFSSTGLSHETGVRMFRVLGYYLGGAMLDETQGYARGPSTVEPVPDDVMARDYPHVVLAGKWFQPAQWERTFELGLKVTLDGIERIVAEAKK
jgi:AcrR family transcriptional regulator